MYLDPLKKGGAKLMVVVVPFFPPTLQVGNTRCPDVSVGMFLPYLVISRFPLVEVKLCTSFFIDVSCAAVLQRQVILPPEGHHETVATWLLERIQKARDTQRCFGKNDKMT